MNAERHSKAEEKQNAQMRNTHIAADSRRRCPEPRSRAIIVQMVYCKAKMVDYRIRILAVGEFRYFEEPGIRKRVLDVFDLALALFPFRFSEMFCLTYQAFVVISYVTHEDR